MNDITEDELNEYCSIKTEKDIYDNYVKGIQELQSIDERTNSILIAGAFLNFDRGITDYLNEMNKISNDLFLLSEVTGEFRRYTKNKIKFSYICTPHLLAKEMVVNGIDISVPKEAEQLYQENTYVSEAVNITEVRQIGLGYGYAKVWGFYAYHYINLLLDKLKPRMVILWNEFYPFHHIFRGICLEHNIHIKYMEFGCIPGTFCIEEGGQQGASFVAVQYKKFNQLYVSRKEVRKATAVIKFIKESGLGRNDLKQKKISINTLRQYDASRKTIFFVGQNDFESGMYWEREKVKKYHSPIFAQGIEAMEYIELLCIKNGWNLIYKSHPICTYLGHDECKDRLFVNTVDEVDVNSIIDISDLVITILSQVAYISLIREKPVLLLGYMQLKGKKCVYEAYEKNKIETEIIKALKSGYTSRQKQYFRKHVARLVKYYLSYDGIDKGLKYGMEVNI